MVVSNEWNLKGKMVESHSLKFGVDRILSEEICSKNSVAEDHTKTVPPCATCLSSLYRCCSLTPVLGLTCFYRHGIQVPQGGLRAFTNVLAPQESSVSINSLQSNSSESGSKRKRSWSRAVFSNLQRKGLEKRFQLQKYITKPDRRQLAATLGLTDAQVKVWFQNRRMKWRHTKESMRQDLASVKETEESIFANAKSTEFQNTDSECESDVDVQTVEM